VLYLRTRTTGAEGLNQAVDPRAVDAVGHAPPRLPDGRAGRVPGASDDGGLDEFREFLGEPGPKLDKACSRAVTCLRSSSYRWRRDLARKILPLPKPRARERLKGSLLLYLR